LNILGISAAVAAAAAAILVMMSADVA